jgi:hypothetical protein
MIARRDKNVTTLSQSARADKEQCQQPGCKSKSGVHGSVIYCRLSGKSG